MSRPRIAIVGAGFAGFSTARALSRLARGRAHIVVVNPTDYFLYLPLLPEVAAGVLEPRRVTVSLAATLPGARLVLGQVDRIDLGNRTVVVTDPEGRAGELTYDRLVIAAGSVNKLLPIPGVVEHAHGFRGVPEALYLRDHVTRQIELADAADDPDERTARTTFVVVGAGYTGTEVAAHGVLLTDAPAPAPGRSPAAVAAARRGRPGPAGPVRPDVTRGRRGAAPACARARRSKKRPPTASTSVMGRSCLRGP